MSLLLIPEDQKLKIFSLMTNMMGRHRGSKLTKLLTQKDRLPKDFIQDKKKNYTNKSNFTNTILNM